jgi:hypothetical protein
MAEHKQCQVQKSTLKTTMKLTLLLFQTLFGTPTTRGAFEDGVIDDDGSLRAPPHSEFHLVQNLIYWQGPPCL